VRQVGIQPTGEIRGIVAHRKVAEGQQGEEQSPDDRTHRDVTFHLAKKTGIELGLQAACGC